MLKVLYLLASIIGSDGVVTISPGTDIVCRDKEAAVTILNAWKDNDSNQAADVFDAAVQANLCTITHAAMTLQVVDKFSVSTLPRKADKELFTVTFYSAVPYGHSEVSPLYFISGNDMGVKGADL